MNRHTVLRNASANFLGKVANRGVRVLLVPLQIKVLGEEAFGLLGLYALAAGLIAVLDLGLSITAQREVARIAGGGRTAGQDIRDLTRTFELPYWLVGGLAGCAVLLSAGWFTDNWVTAPSLSRGTVTFCVTIIGLLLIARWPVSLYRGVLYGLQRQVGTNILAVFVETLNGVGSVAVLLICPKVEAFFVWQLVSGIVEIAGYVWLCWRCMRQRGMPRPRFRPAIFGRVWRYALGVNAMSLIGTVFARSDGFILSKLLPINFLGYYSIAQRAPTLIGIISNSILPATTPIVVALYGQRDSTELSQLYHRQARWLSFLSVGVAFPLAAFAYPLLRLWTQSETVANAVWLAFALLVAASALEIASNSVNQVSLACGFTHPPILVGLAEGAVVAIGTFVLAPRLGVVGAALSWSLSRVVRYASYPLLVNQLVLPGEARQWFLSDTLPIFGIGALCFGGAWGFHRLLVGAVQSGLLWIPVALLAGSLYIGLVLSLNLIPEWRSLPHLLGIWISRSA